MFYSHLKHALEIAWQDVVRNHKTYERDFLREIHGTYGLSKLALAVNADLLPLKKFATFTSVWVDSSPQCWLQQKRGKWVKPSCELADILLVIWDNANKKRGRAILLQGKMATNPFKIVPGSSTKKQLQLLIESPKFLLSNSSKSPTPYLENRPLAESEFCLDELASRAEDYLHCRFLQIRKPGTKAWLDGASSWAAFWPPNAGSITGYARAIADIVCQDPNCLGAPFERGLYDTNWNRLVNILLDTTPNQSGGTAKGPKQTTIASKETMLLASPHRFWRELEILERATITVSSDGDLPRYPENRQDGQIDSGGISTLFVTPREIG